MHPFILLFHPSAIHLYVYTCVLDQDDIDALALNSFVSLLIASTRRAKIKDERLLFPCKQEGIMEKRQATPTCGACAWFTHLPFRSWSSHHALFTSPFVHASIAQNLARACLYMCARECMSMWLYGRMGMYIPARLNDCIPMHVNLSLSS